MPLEEGPIRVGACSSTASATDARNRITASHQGREYFVLKGSLLLARFDAHRTTRDIDVPGRAFPNDEAEIVRRIAAVVATDVDDGAVFDPTTVETVPIREKDEYHGVRRTMSASIARPDLNVQLDISFVSLVATHKRRTRSPSPRGRAGLRGARRGPGTPPRRRPPRSSMPVRACASAKVRPAPSPPPPPRLGRRGVDRRERSRPERHRPCLLRRVRPVPPGPLLPHPPPDPVPECATSGPHRPPPAGYSAVCVGYRLPRRPGEGVPRPRTTSKAVSGSAGSGRCPWRRSWSAAFGRRGTACCVPSGSASRDGWTGSGGVVVREDPFDVEAIGGESAADGRLVGGGERVRGDLEGVESSVDVDDGDRVTPYAGDPSR
ncbi:nucleotidyl transferase AbiEii/AbiGii toxin family protein [Embleya sp. NPDC020630]|uniref:nucleotidyl transferase AbiEii/AbiGii toxin family protein n=1 Tax=Embleya sp. NPDC020630 TaxID=3363979 RepID=UPI00379AE3B5